MNSIFVDSNKSRSVLRHGPAQQRVGLNSFRARFGSILGAFLLLALAPSAVFADENITYYLGIVTNVPGSIWATERSRIQTIAKWGIAYYDAVWPTNNHMDTVYTVRADVSPWTIKFLTITNYYVPQDQIIYAIGANQILTNLYIPYSNTLSVTIAGTNGMSSPVVWSFSERPNEFLNSSAYSNKTFYTNNILLSPIPTGQYTVVFQDVAGYKTPSGSTTGTNIDNSPSTNIITGIYERVCGTITVTVSPTNGSWSLTPPSDFASFSNNSSALSGTSSKTLTNMPVGAYTIKYDPIAGYVSPPNQTQTSTTINTNLAFNGLYALGLSSLKVQFAPIPVQSPARWWVYDESESIDYGPFSHNDIKSLTSSNYYNVRFSTLNDYYVPDVSNLDVFIGNLTILNTYKPYTNDLYITTIDERTNIISAPWTIISWPGEFTNSTAYINQGTNGSAYEEYASVPTGTYRIAYHSMTGFFSPVPAVQTVTVEGASSGDFTGRYTRACGTITVTVSPTNGAWSFTTFPTNFSDYNSPSALSGTNGNTITNAPVGVYTIRYYDIGSPYVTPPDQTQTNTAVIGRTNLLFTGTYTTNAQSRLTVDFIPLAVQPLARWKAGVATPLWLNHHQSVLLENGYDYLIQYSAVKDYWLLDGYTLTNMFGDITITNTYHPYTNSLNVVVTGITDGASAMWSVEPFDNFTNSSAYSVTYTGSRFLSPIPTGTYTIVFSNLYGYTKPPNIVANITGAQKPTVVGSYVRKLVPITVNVDPTNGAWQFSDNPPDFTNYSSSALSGTGNATLTNAPFGSYTITFLDTVPGYGPPVPPTQTKTNEPFHFIGQYVRGWRLTVHVVTAADTNLAGLGFGTCSISPSTNSLFDGVESWYFSKSGSPDITILGIPATNMAFANYFFKWSGAIGAMSPNQNPIVVTMNQDRQIQLYFSRAWGTNDNVGDIDGDGLPDVWELAKGLDPMSDKGDNGAAGNQDLDFIPSSSMDPPWYVLLVTNLSSYSDQGGNAGYPLLRNRLLTKGQAYYQPESLGYANGVPFNNFLECRGLDGYYLNNTPPGLSYSSPYGDDPLTDPKNDDTDGDEMTDGWEYYFWYWRSANAYAIGVTNSANLDWVLISPSIQRYLSPHDSSFDTDGDGSQSGGNDLYEFQNGTDPTHCDTDGDGMDDYWEIQYFGVSNALDYVNWRVNLDGDYYAVSSNRLVLATGMGGTAFSDDVCYIGASNAPSGVWVNTYTNTGSNIFDLYQDTVIKATVALVNRHSGSNYAANTVYYGTNSGLGVFQQGYPVWVDMNGNSNYDAGVDVAIINPPLKHEQVYLMAPEDPFPGVTSFDPRTAWAVTQTVAFAAQHPNTQPYNNYQEYLGGDFVGRLSWDAGGRMLRLNDDDLALVRTSYTNPNNRDTDGDIMEDGWELYVGLDPNYAGDAGLDPDGDKLVNSEEWANVYRTGFVNTNVTIGATDPGVLVAPSPNDPHPRDTDWDGIGDAAEHATNTTCGTAWDTDGDAMPDGWELYAGANPMVADSDVDLDDDGIDNFQEYWTGTVDEWQCCDAAWGASFVVRRSMAWDTPSITTLFNRHFMPPDFLTDGCFMYYNDLDIDIDSLRTNFPAIKGVTAKYETAYLQYHTTLANKPDTDGDGMDDFWEVYHGLNPCKGTFDMMQPAPASPGGYRWTRLLDAVDDVDADPSLAGFQFGTRPAYGGVAFSSLGQMVDHVNSFGTNRGFAVYSMIGPFNFGLQQMDPDGDGLPNLEEYSYSPYRTFYHTDPTPIWRTDTRDENSFVYNNYTVDSLGTIFGGTLAVHPFRIEEVEGYDTDNDGVGDYAEINSTAGELGNNPLDERNPIRNRALYVNGSSDFARTLDSWSTFSESFLTRFCVEAWIKPDNPGRPGDQVIFEKAALYSDPYNTSATIVGANFRLGIINGLPYVSYNGRGALRTYQATAKVYSLTAGVWAHLAGVYDGTTLTLYVNGEYSMSVRTTELPVNGVNASFPEGGTNFLVRPSGHSMMIGARDLTCGAGVPNYDLITGALIPIKPANYYGGCIDEVRVWNGARTQAEVIANKNRIIPRSEMTNSPLVYYYSFDDVQDPLHRNRSGALDEPVAPFGLTNLDVTMSFHPPMYWWASYPLRSTVYTGLGGAYNYLVSAADHVGHMSRVPALDDYYHFSSNYLGTNGISVLDDYNNFSNPYQFSSVFSFDLWSSFNFYWPNINSDMVLFTGARSVTTNSWLVGIDPANPDSTDTDGDCLPDWWEQLYGLDPNDAAGDNGSWGDPDHDGLNNLAEYQAGTDPLNSDTWGTGIGDYDIPRGVYSRTYGEMYTDGDGMPDYWESINGLDPQKYDANLDLDGDGWSNYAEYQAGTAPNNASDYPQPLVSGVANYYGTKTGTLLFNDYNINTMDGVPVFQQQGADNLITETIGTADGSLYFTGKLPLAPIDQSTVVTLSATAGTNSVVVTFTFTGPGEYTYSGPGTDYAAALNYVTGRLTLRWASTAVPVRGANVSVAYNYVNRSASAFSMRGFKEGEFYLSALMDLNGNKSYDANEPFGIMDDQPFYLSYSSISGLRVLVTETRPGFGRFAWTASSASTNAYPVTINKISESGAPTVVQRSMIYPRNYFHEWDFHLAGIDGLMAGTYQWWMNSQSGTFKITWPTTLATPSLVYPRGATLYYAQNQFAWTMDQNCPKAHFQVARQATDGGLAMIMDKYIRAPWMDSNGTFWGWLDEYASDWGNGVYYWRVAGWTPQGESAWSDMQTFHIDLSSTNSCWVSGDIYYFGKAPATKIMLEAFDNRGFGGRPVARMTLTPPASTGWVKCSYTMRGLEKGTYYVRAFLDVTPASSTESNRRLDNWESVGFYRDPNNSYQAGLVNLSDAQHVENARIIIRDRDTDNDELPDAWEMAYFGNLNQTGDMDYDGDGESNLDEYIKDGVNQNPANWDNDGDGLADGLESSYNGAAFGFGHSAKSVGMVLNPNVWDTDGDGYSDGAELLRYHTDPLDPTSYPAYRPLCTDAWPSPGDYDGDGRSDVGIFDSKSGVWSVITMAGKSMVLPFGNTQAQPMVGDYTGDGCSEFTFYEPNPGLWTIYTLSGQSASLQLGGASMLPVSADYTGDGRADLAVFDAAHGVWHIYNIWSGALCSLPFGSPGMIPVPGDYNGDGAADLAVYDPVTGNWLLGCYHKYYKTWTTYSGTLGGPTWMPVPGDYDGDGRNDACLFESKTGRWMLFTLAGQFMQGTFGWNGCVPVPGDYDGDGRSDLALYDTNTGMWYIYCMSGAYYEGLFGWSGAMPMVKCR